MRALLASFLCWLLVVHPALAVVPCAIEIGSGGGGSGGTVVAYSAGTSSNTTLPLTTTQANEPIFVFFLANSQQTTGPAPTITAISPLTFTRRAVAGGLVANCYGGSSPGTSSSTCYMAVEVWEALSPAILTAQNFTITVSTGAGTGSMISSFGITNTVTPSHPFDSNGSLPAVGQQINMANVAPFVSGVSTSNANDLILAFCATVDNISLTTCESQTPSIGWSGPTAGDGFLNAFIGFAYRASLWYKTVSATLSNVTVTPQTPTGKNWAMIADAIVCHGGAPTSTSIPHIWVHE